MATDERATVKQYKKRLAALRNEREGNGWDTHWKEIQKYIYPRGGRFDQLDPNQGKKRHNDIIDNAGIRARRTLSAGLMAGLTSPSRPWFRLSVPDPDMAEYKPVSLWLSELTDRMQALFSYSGLYLSLHKMYDELAGFGTAAVPILESNDRGLRSMSLTAGEYFVAQDQHGAVNTLYREYKATTDQVVRRFGLNRVSTAIKDAYNRGNYDQWHDICQAIEPRPLDMRDTRKMDAVNMPFRSVYFEKARSDEEAVLHESGFRNFPVLCPRWDVTYPDVYGLSPAMESLGDVKQLQHEQLRKGKAIDYQTDPPLVADSKLRDRTNFLPGGVTYSDNMQGQTDSVVRSAFQVNLDLRYLLEDIQDVRERVNSAFYADLFLMVADTDKNMTATEVAERHEEKLLMLGPILERLHAEALKPLIDRVFDVMLRQGMVPPPPPELQGQELKVEFISVLAQAQQAVGTRSIDRLGGFVGNLAQFDPTVLDKFNFDEAVDRYGEALGTPPQVLRSDEEVAALRQQRAEQQQAAAMAEQAQAAANTAKTLSETDTEGNNAYNAMREQFTGPGI